MHLHGYVTNHITLGGENLLSQALDGHPFEGLKVTFKVYGIRRLHLEVFSAIQV